MLIEKNKSIKNGKTYLTAIFNKQNIRAETAKGIIISLGEENEVIKAIKEAKLQEYKPKTK